MKQSVLKCKQINFKNIYVKLSIFLMFVIDSMYIFVGED